MEYKGTSTNNVCHQESQVLQKERNWMRLQLLDIFQEKEKIFLPTNHMLELIE